MWRCIHQGWLIKAQRIPRRTFSEAGGNQEIRAEVRGEQAIVTVIQERGHHVLNPPNEGEDLTETAFTWKGSSYGLHGDNL